MGEQDRRQRALLAAAVTVVLPVTTNCDDQGAICTKDDSGRKLSNSLSFTVSGPGQ